MKLSNTVILSLSMAVGAAVAAKTSSNAKGRVDVQSSSNVEETKQGFGSFYFGQESVDPNPTNKTLPLEVKISEEEINKRRAAWVKPAPRATSGVLYKYMKLVSSASEGCVTDK